MTNFQPPEKIGDPMFGDPMKFDPSGGTRYFPLSVNLRAVLFHLLLEQFK
jgi:hypothetical protein